MPTRDTPRPVARAAYWTLAALFGMNLLNFIDRYILASVLEKVQEAAPAGLGLSDEQAGVVGSAFFLSYAHIWCRQQRLEAARTAVMSQGHSLGHYRVNNVVSNMPEFAHAFSCKPGDPMVRAKSCRVW